MIRRPPRSPLFPSPPLFRSLRRRGKSSAGAAARPRKNRASNFSTAPHATATGREAPMLLLATRKRRSYNRSEEHTSELQSRLHLVCRLLLEKKKKRPATTSHRNRDSDTARNCHRSSNLRARLPDSGHIHRSQSQAA